MDALLNGKTLDEIAIERLREHECRALDLHPEGYWLAFSGGKDSTVILDLAKRAGVKFTAHYNPTCVDPPEIVHFIRGTAGVRIERPPLTMWDWLRKKQIPPYRKARWCCAAMKERGGAGRLIITGVRWSESNRRAQRRMVEPCYRGKTKWYIHPIIDWPTSAVWQYIRERHLPYCSLYDEGFKRVGCVLCPMIRDVKRQIVRWPKIAALWERHIKAIFRPRPDSTLKTPDDYWRWWLDRDAPSPKLTDERVLFEDDPEGIAL